MIQHPDGSLDAWFAASCYDGVHWDQIRYRHSNDGGRTWVQPDDVVVVTPTDGSPDKCSNCDPGAIRFGGYYYVGYTAVASVDGNSNHVFIARSKDPRGPYEKWNGKGWGGAPAIFLRYTGDPRKWGCGEPSFVLKDGKLYAYYSWSGAFVNLAVCNNPFTDDWPAHMLVKGHVISHQSAPGEDSVDVKYVDSLKRFIAVASYNRIFSVNATFSVWQSADGVSWTRTPFRGARVQTGAHNVGISGNEIGHIDGKTQTHISYSYGWPGKDFTGQAFGWANWATFIDPVTISTTTFGLPVQIEVKSAPTWESSGPNAIDGDAKTYWSSEHHDSADAEEWAYVWLGARYAVTALKVTPAPNGLGFPVDFTLQYSNNATNWTNINNYTNYPNSGGKPQVFKFPSTITAAYFRIIATKLSADDQGKYALRLAEITTLSPSASRGNK